MLELNFYNKEIFESILKRDKTIETRALNPEEPDRYFADIKKGENIVFHHIPTGRKVLVKVVARRVYEKFWTFFNSEDLKKIFPYQHYDDDIQLLYAYNKISPGYAHKLTKKGIIAIEFIIINEDYNV